MDPLLQSKGTKPRRGAVLTCPQCSGSFYVLPAHAAHRKYCSRACKAAAESRPERLQCQTCSVEFERVRSRGGRFCSWECYRASRPARAECKRCGNPLPLLCRQYCSKECTRLARMRGVEGRCEQCGAAMYLQPAQVGKQRFCSWDCSNKGKQIDGPGYVRQRPDGYVEVYYPKHPDATQCGRILQHRLVAEEKYGRRILPTEHIHHINGDRADNRPENLEVITPGDHARVSVKQGVKKRRTMEEELEEYRKRFGPLNGE